MARQLRVQFPGAIHHLVTRGDGRNLRLEKRSMEQLPLGVQINRIAIIRKSPVRFFYNPQYNFRDLPGNTCWQLVFGVSLLTQ